MNKQRKSVFCAIFAAAILLLSCVLASAKTADIQNISVAETENGSVTLTDGGNNEAIITLKPDKGYLTASVKMTAADGKSLKLSETETANVYSCPIPENGGVLTAEFRRTGLTLDREELAMSTGETVCISAKLTYLDGEVQTRGPVKNSAVVFSSSNPEVVSVDPVTGKLSANKMGYSRITATACAGNDVKDFFYVIVDGDKDEVVGTLQLNAYFEEKDLLKNGMTGIGHSFLVFTNTSGEDITLDVADMVECYIPTAKYDDMANSYDGTGYNPLTYYYATQGEAYTDENEAVRAAWLEELLDQKSRGEIRTYTVKPNRSVTFDNSGRTNIETDLGDLQNVLTRYGISLDGEELKQKLAAGEITIGSYMCRLNRCLIELSYDLHTGYSPVNGASSVGGERLNYAVYHQAYNRDYQNAVGCKITITRVQLMAMVEYLQYDSWFNFLGANCTSVAASGWNLVTADTPRYHMTPNGGGITTALAAPMWLRNDILAKSITLAWDKDIQFIKGLGVLKI